MCYVLLGWTLHHAATGTANMQPIIRFEVRIFSARSIGRIVFSCSKLWAKVLSIPICLMACVVSASLNISVSAFMKKP